MRNLGLIFIGGLLGTVLRYELSRLDSRPSVIPVGILIANLAGTFILGGVISYLTEYEPSNAVRIRAAWGTGFCGGLTTFSTLCAGIVDLSRNASVTLTAIYAITSLVLGVLAFQIGVLSVQILQRLEWSRGAREV